MDVIIGLNEVRNPPERRKGPVMAAGNGRHASEAGTRPF